MKKALFFILSIAAPVVAFSQFSVYNTSNSGINSNTCWGIKENPSTNAIWVSTQTDGINVLTGPNWTNFTTFNSSIGANYITAMAFETSGTAWVGAYTNPGGVFKYNGTSWTTYSPSNSPVPDNQIVSIVIDQANNKWIGTRNNGLCKFDGTTWTIYNTSNSNIPANVVYALELDGSGNLWVGTGTNGLSKFNGTTWTNYTTSNSSLPGNNVYCLKYNAYTNSMWVGTFNGIAVINGSAWTIYNTSTTAGFPNDYVRGISFPANSSSAWIATGYGGIGHYSFGSWVTYNHSNSNLPCDSIWAICVSASNKVWASTITRGIVSIASQTGIDEAKSFKAPLALFPNPAQNQVDIVLPDAQQAQDAVIDVVNQLGQLVYSEKQRLQPQQKITINVSTFAKGLYILRVSTQSYAGEARLLKD